MKRSLRAARMERHHKRFGSATLSLVSLMDIFTILVFFLLVNSSDVRPLPNSKAIQLPSSVADEFPAENLLVLVSREDIIVQGRKVASVAAVLKDDKLLIEPLKKELNYQASLIWDKHKAKSVEGAEVTVMGDRAIPYKLLRRIMLTLAETPYKRISLAVNKKSTKGGN